MRSGLLALPAVLFVASAWAGQGSVDRIELVQYGLYRADKTGQIEDKGTTTGTTNLLANIDFYETTSLVPACRGIGFGLVFRPVGQPDGASVTVRHVWQLPEPGLLNPDNRNTYRRSVSDSMTPLGDGRFHGYTFEHDWEMVTGDWTLEIWNANRRLLAKTFAVYRAACTGPVS